MSGFQQRICLTLIYSLCYIGRSEATPRSNDIYSGHKTVFATSIAPPLGQPAFPDSWLGAVCRKSLIDLGRTIKCDDESLVPEPAVFTSPGHDLYLFTVFLATQSDLRAVIAGQETEVGMSRYVVNWMQAETEKISGTFLMDVEAGSELSIEYYGHIYPKRLHSWTGFSVSGTMEPIVAFSVGNSLDVNSPGIVSFDSIMVNTGSYDEDRNSFVCPMSGIYFFHVSAGVYASGLTKVRLLKNSEKWLQMSFNLGDNYDNDTLTTSTLMQLDQGDIVRLKLTKGELRSTDSLTETSLSGFYYSPRDTDPVAWLIYKTDMFDIDTREGAMLSYNKASLLHGDVTLNPAKTTLRVPASGFYQIHISVGCREGSVVVAGLITNGFIRRHMLIKHMTDDFTSRSVHTGSYVVHLNDGDEVGVWRQETEEQYQGNLFGTNDMETSFMGFRIL